LHLHTCVYIVCTILILLPFSLPSLSPVLPFCRRKNIKEKKGNMEFLLIWDKDSYTGRFLMLFPCIYILHPQLVHLYQSSLLLISSLPMLAPASLRFLYSFLYTKHINCIQVFFNLLPLHYLPCMWPPLSVTHIP
jgi:hypothetical protein